MEQISQPGTPEKSADEILRETIEAKVKELEAREKVSVHPILFFDVKDTNKTDPIIGYIKEPPRMTKIRVLDKASQLGDFAASSELLTMCLIKDASDNRIYTEKPEYDSYFLGACYEAQKILSISISQFKKK